METSHFCVGVDLIVKKRDFFNFTTKIFYGDTWGKRFAYQNVALHGIYQNEPQKNGGQWRKAVKNDPNKRHDAP